MMPNNPEADEKLIKDLRLKAKRNASRHADTPEWRAADRIESLSAEIARLRERVVDEEVLARELREQSRYPSGGPRISPDKARDIVRAAIAAMQAQ